MQRTVSWPMALVLTLSVLAGCVLASCAESPPPDLADAVRSTPGSALVLYDVATQQDVLSVRGDSAMPVVGLTALLTALAAEDLSPSARAVRLPASHLRRRRLPGLEPERADTVVWTLNALLAAALRGDRAAADEALAQVGRARVQAATPDSLDAPLPVGGLILAWAPERRGVDAPASVRADSFRALAPSAQRDSAFARDRAFLNSQAYRADETVRLQRRGLGLDADVQDALAAETLPGGTAAAYARLAARPVLRDRLLTLRATPSAPARTAVAEMGSLGAALSVSPDGARIGVLIWRTGLGLDAARALSAWVTEETPASGTP